jgi:hypothetical protein
MLKLQLTSFTLPLISPNTVRIRYCGVFWSDNTPAEAYASNVQRHRPDGMGQHQGLRHSPSQGFFGPLRQEKSQGIILGIPIAWYSASSVNYTCTCRRSLYLLRGIQEG